MNPQKDILGDLELTIPDELYSRLLYWIRLSNSSFDVMCSPVGKCVVGEGSIFVRKLSKLISQIYDQDLEVLTTENLDDFLSTMLVFLDACEPQNVSAKPRLLGELYGLLYQEYGQLEDVELGIKCYTLALVHPLENHAIMLEVLANLGGLLHSRFKVTGELSDLHHALEYRTQAMSLTPDGHRFRAACLNNLAITYLSRFEVLGQLQDLDSTLKYQAEAESLEPENSPYKQNKLTNLGNAHIIRYEYLGQLQDIDASISYHDQANRLPYSDPLCEALCLNNLAVSHATRYDRIEDILDLEASMGYSHRAVLLLPDGHPDRPGFLANLGSMYNNRYGRLRVLSDLETAIEFYRLAASLVLDRSLARPLILNRLGSAYLSRYQRLGVVVDIDQSIFYNKRSVDLTPASHIERFRRLNTLSSSYIMRFDRLYQTQDLEAAIDVQHKANVITPDNHPQKPFCLRDLARAYYTQYEYLGNLGDLDMAAEFQRQAIWTTPDSHPIKVELLESLTKSCQQRYKHLGRIEDLELAIRHTQQLISLIADRSSKKPAYLGKLGTAYYSQYECLNTPRDLDLAIEYGRSAILGFTNDYANRAKALNNLGQYLSDRFDRFKRTIDMSQSIECFQEAAHSAEIDPRIRIHAARSWATSCVLHQPESALGAYQYFMSLIPRVAWLGLATQQRYNEVSKIAQVTLDATVVASAIYKDSQVLVWLEQGRSIIWGQLLQLHSPFDQLRTVDSSLAEELWCVANELQVSASLQSHIAYEEHNTSSFEHASQRHRRLVERWEELVHQVQSLPATSNFLTTKDPLQLLMAAQDRTVVIVLVSRLLCLALIIRQQASNEVECLPLRSLTYNKVVEARNRLARRHDLAIRADRKLVIEPIVDNEYHQVLSMLWTDVAKPVLDSLEYTKVLPLEGLPHITWCTTGPLSFLPLYAAGDYTQPFCSLSDYCISSYTPTLSALLASPNDPSTFSGIALVSQASTPGFSPLPGTEKELDTITRHTKTIHTMRLDGEHATSISVLTAIEQHSWVHLACHASQNSTNPTKSAFHLHDGPLDLGAVSRKQLKHAELAFLSACQTATGDTELSDEAVHLAAGMIFAGYRTVIATMWPIHDKDAPLVADWFYEYMLRDGLPGRGRAARALHYAVGRLKQQVGIEAYSRWAPFIHIGI